MGQRAAFTAQVEAERSGIGELVRLVAWLLCSFLASGPRIKLHPGHTCALALKIWPASGNADDTLSMVPGCRESR
jgi:hypothetical protein